MLTFHLPTRFQILSPCSQAIKTQCLRLYYPSQSKTGFQSSDLLPWPLVLQKAEIKSAPFKSTVVSFGKPVGETFDYVTSPCHT